MAYRVSKSLTRLRAQREEFLEALDRSPPMRPFAHWLRDLVDTRPTTEKIQDAVERCAVAPSRLHTPRERVGCVMRKIEAELPWLALSAAPDRKTVSRCLVRSDKKKREMGATFPLATVSSVYAQPST